MRRLTWMRYNHFVATCKAGWLVGRPLKYFKSRIGFVRPPMQRTEYYMPWGVVTVDELSKLEDHRKLTHYAEHVAVEDWDDDAPYEFYGR